MTDYSEWTETEVEAEEFAVLPTDRRGFDNHVRGNHVVTTYFRLDPPAPTYREGEMRWAFGPHRRALVHWVNERWEDVNDRDCWWEGGDFTLSDPVVVVPAPTDEERAAIERNYGDMGEESLVGSPGGWLVRVVPALREATR